MKPYTPHTSRDSRIAAEVGMDRALQCIASGCPNRWTVDAGNGMLCSAHAWCQPHSWPQVTQEQLDAAIDRARYSPEQKPTQRLSASDKRELLERLRGIVSGIARAQPAGPKAWAVALRKREESGERLTPAQREMWRAAYPSSAGHETEGAPA